MGRRAFLLPGSCTSLCVLYVAISRSKTDNHGLITHLYRSEVHQGIHHILSTFIFHMKDDMCMICYQQLKTFHIYSANTASAIHEVCAVHRVNQFCFFVRYYSAIRISSIRHIAHSARDVAEHHFANKKTLLMIILPFM